MFTPKLPDSRRMDPRELDMLMLARSDGGSADRLHTAVAVIPTN
jgi:hypothetical protein